ncbi:MAG: alpha/beta hydrolase [Alphaproteobacteria bacterium]|nr:alpha/beta hydrolase [Alphaproteobacteria bacterium]
MALDPSVQAMFDQFPNMANYPRWELSPAEARQAFKQFYQIAMPPAVAIGKTENIHAPGTAGELPLRIYTPVAAGGESLPAIVFTHGGGFVVGDLDCYDTLCRNLANDAGARVIAVDYRLAPEHPFPAAVEDCFAALKWIEANAPDLGVDPNRITVAGDSAGGNLAAVMCLLAKENKGNPHIGFQLLIYPALGYGLGGSEESFAEGYYLTAKTIDWLMAHYLPKDSDRSDPRIAPVAAKDFAGLPPAYIVTAGFDPLRDGAILYVDKLKAAGVPVTHIDYPTMIHGFMNMQAFIPVGSEALAAAAQAVKNALG